LLIRRRFQNCVRSFLARFGISGSAAFFGAIALILGLYSYPALRTAATTESKRLPAVSAPDLGLYLAMSNLVKGREGSILNPYYRISVPANSVGFLKFRLGPMLFGFVDQLLAGRLWTALFVWNLFWWGCICVAAIYLFEQFLPRGRVELVLAGLSLLMLFSFAEVRAIITAWTHLPSTRFFNMVELPYIRPFTPQVTMPLLLCYIGLQIRALKGKTIAPWVTMAFIQFFAMAAFPYATLMMAGTTAVSVVWYISRSPGSAWRRVLGFFLVCSLADAAYLLHGSTSLHYGSPDQTSLIHLQLSLAPKSIGRLWVLIGLLGAATALNRKIPPEVKWPLVGVGLSNMLFAFGDAVLPERIFFITDHIGYFYQSTIVILLIVAVPAYAPLHGRALRLLRITSVAIVGFCFLNGFLVAEGNYRRYLPFNWEQADMAKWFDRNQVSANDLVITQFETTQYDTCEWIPILSDAESLYCRNAQVLLTPKQNHDEQRLREVMYLYFNGKDHQWLENTIQFERYGLYGEVTSFHTSVEQAQRIVDLRREMGPLFDRVEHGDPAIRDFFRRFGHVWIIQEAQNPAFADSRLNSYLDFKDQERAGSLVITASIAK